MINILLSFFGRLVKELASQFIVSLAFFSTATPIYICLIGTQKAFITL